VSKGGEEGERERGERKRRGEGRGREGGKEGAGRREGGEELPGYHANWISEGAATFAVGSAFFTAEAYIVFIQFKNYENET
jgi:hypothetical protein